VVAPERKLRVRARAWADPNSTLPVRLEVVRHGEVIQSAVSPDSKPSEVSLDFTVDATDGFWIAARARTGIGTSAHTTPVYVVRQGLRFWKFEAIEELIQKRLVSLAQIEQVVAAAQADDRGMRLATDRNRKQLALNGSELLKRVSAARDLYTQLRQTAVDESRRRTAQPDAAPMASAPKWKLIAEQNFPVADEFPRWKLEGAATVSVTMFRTLLVETRRSHIEGSETDASAIWFDEPPAGDIRIEFDAQADAGTRASFFFNARPRGNFKSIFDWRRPRARDEDYAADDRIELYAIEILRSNQDTVALRYLGEKDSAVLATAPNPFTGAPEKVYHFDIRVNGARVSVQVDGRVIFELTDEARRNRPLAGGYFGFRNARPGGLSFDNVRLYRTTD
jgi:hypothetical protein